MHVIKHRHANSYADVCCKGTRAERGKPGSSLVTELWAVVVSEKASQEGREKPEWRSWDGQLAR